MYLLFIWALGFLVSIGPVLFMWLPGNVSVFHVYLGPSINYFFIKPAFVFGLYRGIALCLFYFFCLGHINKPCVMAMLKFLLCLCFNFFFF